MIRASATRRFAFPPALPAGRDFDVVGIGANAADHLLTVPHFPQPGEKVRFRRHAYQGGGQTATAMVAVARLGYRACYLGAVGDDADGTANLAGLRAEGVDVSGVRVRPGEQTQRAFILVDEATGERTIVWGRSDGLILQPDEVDEQAIARGRLLHADAQQPLTAWRAAQAAHQAAMPVLADLEVMRPGLESFLPLVDFLIVDEMFPARATGSADLAEAARILEERSGALVIVTLGSKGAVARVEGRLQLFPAFAVSAVDTTGAGDVFHGAFAVALLRGLPLPEAIDFSHAVAAMKCLHQGGRSGIPRGIEAVERFRREAQRADRL